jgi:hypothetical protein
MAENYPSAAEPEPEKAAVRLLQHWQVELELRAQFQVAAAMRQHSLGKLALA